MTITENDLLKALAADYAAGFRRDGEFTAQEFWQASGGAGSIKNAMAYLEKQFRAGKLKRRKISVDGHWCLVYSANG